MFFITILHTEGFGGILGSVSFSKENVFLSHFSVAWFLEIMAYCAVNCYALASGYLTWNREVKYSRLVHFWIQVLFYSSIITIIFSYTEGFNLVFPQLFMPIINSQYWYMTSYFIVFLFMPILNSYIKNTENKKLKTHIILLFILSAVIPRIFQTDPFTLHDGYSPLWLILLYILGGILAKTKWGHTLSKKKSLINFFIMVFLTWLSVIILQYTNGHHSIDSMLFVSYCSPTIILSGVFLFIFCEKINVMKNINKHVVSKISSATLGIYLIHEQPYIRKNFIGGYSQHFVESGVLLMSIKILLGALSIFIICLSIELIRDFLFRKLRINKCIDTICSIVLK